MTVDNPVELVERAGTLVRENRFCDAEALLSEAWRLAEEGSDDWARGDIAFRIAATYRERGRLDDARRFYVEAARWQRRAFGLS